MGDVQGRTVNLLEGNKYNWCRCRLCDITHGIDMYNMYICIYISYVYLYVWYMNLDLILGQMSCQRSPNCPVLFIQYVYIYICMQVWSFRKLNGGTPKSSKLDHFSIETFMVTWGSTILSNPHIISFWIMQIIQYNWLVVWNIFYFSTNWEE